jgi:WhiB family redox-sensing transcriptional regulator
MIPRGENLSIAGGPAVDETIRAQYQGYEAKQIAATLALRATMDMHPGEPVEETIRASVVPNNPYSLPENEKKPDWQEKALCRTADPEAFFPEKGGSTRAAKAICLACGVRADCLDYALSRDERFGIWGGMSERERRRLKKRSI